MSSPFADYLRVFFASADPLSVTLLVLAVVAVLVFLVVSKHRVESILLIVIASGALVGSLWPIVDSVAGLVRWFGIGILMSLPLISRGHFFRGSLIFYSIYALGGVFFLFNSVNLEWQIQRAVLLIATTIAIPTAAVMVAKDAVSLKQLFKNIAIIGSVIIVISAFQLPAQFATVDRFTGISRNVPHFALVLGALLPFVFLAMWEAENFVWRSLFQLAFAVGVVCLLLTAQRTGSIAGLIGCAPLALSLGRSQKVRVAFLAGAAVLGLFLFRSSLVDTKFDYIESRYELGAGLSNRDVIWSEAYAMISDNILIGHGTGAGESVREFKTSFHNAYLEAWYNAGLLGLLCFIAAQVRAVYVAARLLKREGGGQLKGEIALSLGYILAVCFVSFFESAPAGASMVLVVLFLVCAATMEGIYNHRIPHSTREVHL